MKWTICAWCSQPKEVYTGHVNRARKMGMSVYCSRVCSGLARRKNKTAQQKKAGKREYDKARRANPEVRERKMAYAHAWFREHYDPEKARVERRTRMPRHVEYCRQPEYRRKKRLYDKALRAAEYGPYAEAHELLMELEREIRARCPNRYERLKARGYVLNKAKQRRRNARISRG